MTSHRAAPLPMLPQIVPSQTCFRCDVCCRFPEADSFLRPYFTEDEITRAVLAGIAPSHFPDKHGSQVSVVQNPSGEGYLCPAFDPSTSQCTIYAARPLDCQIYPLALMWNAAHTEVVLGWDTKCPFLRDVPFSAFHSTPEDLKGYGARMAEIVEREDVREGVARNPRLVGPYQDDVMILCALPGLTRRMVPRTSHIRSQASCSLPLTPLRLEDRPWFEEVCATVETPLGAYAFAYHFIWKDLFAYSYAEVGGYLCLFAEYSDGIFMPLPPLAGEQVIGTRQPDLSNGRYAETVAICFEFMRQRNLGSAVSRIENVTDRQKAALETYGYRLTPKDPDYLYSTADLTALAGDRYKSQRAAVNRFHRLPNVRIEAYGNMRRENCLKLFDEWAEQKYACEINGTARQMLHDSASAHRYALTYAEQLGLTGFVVWVDEAIRAYTLGYDRPPQVFCVLLEVADRTIHGLAQFLFQETCLEAKRRHVDRVNTLDDSGLKELAKSKRAYHPIQLVANHVAVQK